MTKTIQPRSWKTEIYVTDNDLLIKKPGTEDTASLLLTLSNNLNNLYENINRLNYLIKRYVSQNKKMEQILYPNKKEEKK